MKVSLLFKFNRLDQKLVGLAWQASPLLLCFWLCLINLISKDTNMLISISDLSMWTIVCKRCEFALQTDRNYTLYTKLMIMVRDKTLQLILCVQYVTYSYNLFYIYLCLFINDMENRLFKTNDVVS